MSQYCYDAPLHHLTTGRRKADMEISKEELVVCIERARKKLDGSIANKDDYRYIYENSIALDRLLEIYISMEY